MNEIDIMFQEFVEKIRANEVPTKLMTEILNYYSERITKAMLPLTNVSLPFAYAVMRIMTKELEKNFPERCEAGKALLKELKADCTLGE